MASDGILQLKGFDVTEGWLVPALAQRQPSTPSEWFGRLFPKVQERCGVAFLESVSLEADGRKKVTPIDMNLDFIAGVVGGDSVLRHKCVFISGEQTWYFLEPRNGLFTPTTDEKIKLLLSQYLRRCAEAMPPAIDIRPLFGNFRSEETLRSILKKAKAMHAADETFFSADSRNLRVNGREMHQQLARVFIRKAVKPQPEKLLTVTECFELFCAFCKANGIEPLERRCFTPMVEDLVREHYSLNLRKDILGANQRHQRGWKGLSVDLQSITSSRI